MHVAEKYQQLARDAQAAGDRVMFESYNQHAEHYLRIVAAAQPQQPQQQPSRHDAEEPSEAAPVNGTPSANNADGAFPENNAPVAQSKNVVEEDSPQPFIDNIPVIDQEGQLNGVSAGEVAAATQEEEKPRRRTRSVRGRPPRRPAQSAGGEADDTMSATAEAGTEEAETPAPKRRAPRRRAAPVENETVSAGE